MRLIRLAWMARSTTLRSWSRSKGLSRYSNAPSFIASMAVSVLPCAVITMTGSRASIWRIMRVGFQARHVGQPHVENHGVRRVLADALDSFAGGAGGADLESRGFQRPLQRIAHVRLVVDYQHTGHRHFLPSQVIEAIWHGCNMTRRLTSRFNLCFIRG